MFAATGRSISNAPGLIAGLLLAGVLAAGCSGGDGASGAAGTTGPTGPSGPTGPAGPSGPVMAFDVTTASAITGTITSVSSGSQPTVTFKLVDQIGQPLKGLPASAIRFTAAKLVPGTNGGSSQWVSYINRSEAATVVPANATTGQPASWGTAATRQANAEAATTTGAVYTDKGDGTYTYTFAKDLGQQTVLNNPGPGPAIAFEPNATTRIGFEIRATGLNATNNPVYTYVPATGSTTTLPERRDVVNTAECAACHDKLAFHGGPRTDVQYCVTCHNPGTTDAQSGNSLDMKVMVHKIHRGIELPTVANTRPNLTAPIGPTNMPNVAAAQGKGYTIWGNAGSFNNFNDIEFTQDQRNCTTCHRESDTSTPQASNWRNVANIAACGACHDDIDFKTGAGHGTGGVADDTQCLTCHGPNSQITANGKGIKTETAHIIPEIALAKTIKWEVLRIEPSVPTTPACAASVKNCTVPKGAFPKVTIRAINPVTNTAYSLSDPLFVTNTAGTTKGSITVRIAYTTTNYTNLTAAGARSSGISISFVSNGAVNAAVVNNGDGTYTATATTAIPNITLLGGSGTVFIEGRAIGNVAPAGQPASYARIPVGSSDPLYFPITDTSAVARRTVTETARCNQCHSHLDLVHGTRNDQVELCTVCHDPLWAGGSSAAVSTPFDLKYLVHSLHSANYKFGSIDFTGVGYPGSTNNCEGCHKADTYYPVDQNRIANTTIWAGPTSAPTDDWSISPTVSACSGCHQSKIATAHMQQNGGVVIPINETTGRPDPTLMSDAANRINTPLGLTDFTKAPAESCAACHGPGATADVKAMHQVTSFTFR